MGFLARENSIVGWLWRLVGAALAAGLLALLIASEAARTAVFRYDAQLIDAWQRGRAGGAHCRIG